MVQIQTKSMGMVNMPAKERPKLSYFQGLVTISRVSYLGFYFEFKAMMSCMLNVNQVLVPKYHKGLAHLQGSCNNFQVSILCLLSADDDHPKITAAYCCQKT